MDASLIVGNECNFPFEADIFKDQAYFQRLEHVSKGHLLVGLSHAFSFSNHSNAFVKFRQTKIFLIEKFQYFFPEIKNPL